MAPIIRRKHPRPKRFVPYDPSKHRLQNQVVGMVCYPPYARQYDLKKGVSCLLLTPGELKAQERKLDA